MASEAGHVAEDLRLDEPALLGPLVHMTCCNTTHDLVIIAFCGLDVSDQPEESSDTPLTCAECVEADKTGTYCPKYVICRRL
jgi:hypothetical protein